MSDDHCELLCLDLAVAEAIRARRLDLPGLERAAARAAALADPTRLSLAAALAQADELCLCDLAWIAERPQNPWGAQTPYDRSSIFRRSSAPQSGAPDLKAP